MLMALLPLSGWAADVDLSTATITLGSDQLTYVGKATKPAITVTVGTDEVPSTKFEVLYYDADGAAIAAANVRDAGSYKLGIKASATGYTGETAEANRIPFTINKVPLKIQIEDAEKKYGDTDPAATDIQYTVLEGNVGEDDVNGITVKFAFSATPRATGENVSEAGYAYNAITCTSTNYTVTYENTPKLIIKKATLHASYSGGEFIVKNYGEANPTLAATDITYTEADWKGAEATGTDEEKAAARALAVTGTITYTQTKTDANAKADGTLLGSATTGYPLTIEGLTSDNYEVVLSTTTMKIKQVALAATPATLPDSKYFTYKAEGDLTYNAADQEPTYTIVYKDAQKADHSLVKGTDKDFTVSYSYSDTEDGTYSTTTETKKAGYYKATITAVATGNYSGSVAEVLSFQIAKKPLYVYAKDKSKPYDGAAYDLKSLNAATDFEYNGLVETITPTYVTGEYVKTDWTEAEKKSVNEFKIKAVIATSSNLNTNYAPQGLETGKFTITARPITLTAKDQSIYYGQDTPSFKANTTYIDIEAKNDTKGTGLADDTDLEKTAVLKAVTKIGLKAGTPTTVSNNEDAIELTIDNTKAPNYAITAVAGDYEIKGATYTLIAKNKSVEYGTAVALTDFEYVTTGTTPAATVTFELYKGTTKLDEVPTTVGTYTVKIVQNDAYLPENYELPIDYVDGTFEITAKALKVIPQALTLNKGASVADLNNYGTVKYEGLVEGDEIGYDLAFNVGTETGQVVVDGSGNLNSEAAEAPYAKGVKVAAKADVSKYDNANYTIDWTATAALTVIAADVLLLDANDANLLDKIEAADDGTERAVKFSTTKKLAKGRWNTLVLPFETTVTKLSAALGYAVVDMIDQDNTDESKVSLKLAFGTIPANTPFLVQPTEDVSLADVDYFSTNKVTIKYDAEPKAEDKGKHALVGTYEGLTITDANTQYYYSPSEKKFLSAANNKIAIFGAYLLDNSGSSSAPMIYIQEIDGSVTAIDVVSGTSQKIDADGSWYTVNGVKLDAAPTQKGIYIKNGKKFVVK